MNRLLFLSLLLFTLEGCSLFKTETVHQPLPIQQPAMAEKQVEVGSFSKETLSALLIAEFAGYRGDYDTTLNNYINQAKHTQDPHIIERAYQLASVLSPTDEAKEMALLWTQAAPTNLLARQAAAVQLTKHGELEQAYQHMSYILEQNKNAELGFLIDATASLDNQTRANLIDILNKLSQNNPNHIQLKYLIAQLFEQNGQAEEALKVLQKIPLEQQTSALILIQADILKGSGKAEQATQLLKEQLTLHPEDKELHLAYARLLVSLERLTEAKQQLSILVATYPEYQELKLTIALISLENQEWDEAIKLLHQLIEQNIYPDSIYYYLGSAYLGKQQPEQALAAFNQVSTGEHFLAAKSQIATLLVSQKKFRLLQENFLATRQAQPDYAIPLYLLEIEALINGQQFSSALTLANQAIKAHPKDINLLYSRSMVAEKTNNIKQAEQDLRAILKLDPKNASALNALGYTLANKTTRYKEAFKLIQAAYEIDPDNPATLDSLGWINFRLGNLDAALHYTKQAYQYYPDAEVAAHLVEILWHLGQYQEAETLWQKALKEAPYHPILQEVIDRLTNDKKLKEL